MPVSTSIGESVAMYWQKFSGFLPIGQSAEDILVNVRWTLANGESPICQIPIGEVPVIR